MLVVANLLFSGRRALQAGQDHAALLPKLQTAMGQVVREIRSANTTNPPEAAGLGTLLPTNLPLLPYNLVEGASIYLSSTQYPFPASPAALMFPSQALESDKWRPRASSDAESNSLVFYRVQAGVVHRITLSNKNGQLVKEDQSPISSATVLASSPTPVRQVLLDDLVSVQFTFPLLDDETSNPAAALSPTDREILLNSRYRTLVGVRFAAQASTKGKPLELSEQVEVRN